MRMRHICHEFRVAMDQLFRATIPLILTINTPSPVGQMWGKGVLSFGPDAEGCFSLQQENPPYKKPLPFSPSIYGNTPYLKLSYIEEDNP